MRAAILLLDPWGVATAVVLCCAYRVVNAAGWGLVLGSLGEPVRTVPAVRVWLASEACRWIPGSIWAFGSRAVLASERGIPLRAASASVLLELLATVVAWIVVAMLGVSSLPLPGVFRTVALSEWLRASWTLVIYGVTIAGMVILTIVACRRTSLSKRLWRGLEGLRSVSCQAPDARRVARAILYFTAMAAFNGLILLVVVRSLAAGTGIAASTVIAANAVAWLVGFFAIFAPGGLIVREACLAGLLSTWIPAEQAFVVAVAWRLVQVVAEILTFGAVAVTGLPAGSLLRLPPDFAEGRGDGELGHADGTSVRPGTASAICGVA